jgi:tetratricopeptide (TPR) repeat protein
MTSASTALAAPAKRTPDVSDLLRAGREHCRRGEVEQAIAIFQAGLALAATVSVASAVEGVADLHAALANAFVLCDDVASAAENYKAALHLAPHLVACWCNLGIAHQRSGMAQEAIALYLEALRLNPAHRPSRTNLVQALIATGQFVIARTLLIALLEETADEAELHSQIGKVCFELDATGEAIAHFERAIALAPAQAENFYWIGAIRQMRGESDAARKAYADAALPTPIRAQTFFLSLLLSRKPSASRSSTIP